MKNRLLLTALVVIISLSLTGCQLARADGVAAEESDTLVGAYITTEYLDLFDFESYFNENASKIMRGGEISADDSRGYGGRVYAELRSRILSNEDTGERHHDWEYVFEGLEGIPFFTARITTPDGNSFWGATTGEGISDGHFGSGDNAAIEGTIYMTPRSTSTVYINPVYQSADGSVYVVSGSGFSTVGVSDEGSVYSQTLEETHTVTENGKTREFTSCVTVHVATKRPTKLLRVIFMSAENNIISQTEFAPDKLPESVVPSGETAYIIVETVTENSGETELKRQILEPGDNWITAFAAREDGICLGVPVPVEWGQTA